MMKTILALIFLTLLLPLPSIAFGDVFESKEVPAWITIYLPVENSRLERRNVKGKLYNFMPTALTTYASVVAEQALPLLFGKSRSSFPNGTRLTTFPKIQDGVMQISLSKEFLGRGFWNNKKRTFLAVYAIVNTAAEGYGGHGSELRVRLLIEGKPFRNLANLDMRKPLQPRFVPRIRRTDKSARKLR